MAIYAPSESPAVVTREIDLTNGVPNVPTSTGAICGEFRWGPCEEPVLINNEGSLVSTFASPNDTTSVEFHSASYYLRYSNDLLVTRVIDNDSVGGTGPKNAFNAAGSTDLSGNTAPSPQVLNQQAFDDQFAALDSAGYNVIGKYPGELGNGLCFEIVGSNHADATNAIYDSDFTNWSYRNSFDTAPGTSAWAAERGVKNDEVHAVLVDTVGDFTGTKNTVLETYAYVSKVPGAQKSDGTNNYLTDVVNQRSSYVKLGGTRNFGTNRVGAVTNIGLGAGLPAADGNDLKMTSGSLKVVLASGTNGGSITQSDYQRGYNKYNDVNSMLLDFLIAPSLNDATNQTTLVNHLVTIAAATRKDCVVFTSPNRNAVVNNSANALRDTLGTAASASGTGVSGFTRSSYLVVDNNFLKVYDKFNDKFIFIPAASSTAGLCAATDNNFAPWFSPAGTRRGQYFGVTGLATSPNKSERDQLYRAGINPVTNMPGSGILLFGDKTFLDRPSAFDRINVRRLFLVIERAIAEAAKNILFEFNDEFTRAEFINIVEPLLRDIKGRRGIQDFRLVADETNNTASIIDTNQFVASLFIKPSRSVNFITLNFVAVRTGVSFEEVVGQAT